MIYYIGSPYLLSVDYIFLETIRNTLQHEGSADAAVQQSNSETRLGKVSLMQLPAERYIITAAKLKVQP